MITVSIDRLRIVRKSDVLVDLALQIRSSTALVGESGSGKSLTLKSLLGLVDPALEVVLEKRSGFTWERGKSVALVPQNPFTALSPLTKIKDQLFVPRERSEALFGMLGLGSELLERYPPELSGGQLQRVVVATALAGGPKLLLLDEPTTALDERSKTTMIELLKSLQKAMGFSMLFVTHDMGVASALCEDICVIRNGRIVETGSAAQVVSNPVEEYTRALIDAEFKNRGFRI